MAKQVKLSARPRVEAGRNSVKQVRARGAVPAVIYGKHMAKPLHLAVDPKSVRQAINTPPPPPWTRMRSINDFGVLLV